jgi:hypothetical protein
LEPTETPHRQEAMRAPMTKMMMSSLKQMNVAIVCGEPVSLNI